MASPVSRFNSPLLVRTLAADPVAVDIEIEPPDPVAPLLPAVARIPDVAPEEEPFLFRFDGPHWEHPALTSFLSLGPPACGVWMQRKFAVRSLDLYVGKHIDLAGPFPSSKKRDLVFLYDRIQAGATLMSFWPIVDGCPSSAHRDQLKNLEGAFLKGRLTNEALSQKISGDFLNISNVSQEAVEQALICALPFPTALEKVLMFSRQHKMKLSLSLQKKCIKKLVDQAAPFQSMALLVHATHSNMQSSVLGEALIHACGSEKNPLGQVTALLCVADEVHLFPNNGYIAASLEQVIQSPVLLNWQRQYLAADLLRITQAINPPLCLEKIEKLIDLSAFHKRESLSALFLKYKLKHAPKDLSDYTREFGEWA